MLDTMTRYLSAITDSAFQRAIRYVVKPSIDRLSSQALTSAGLMINAGGATFARLTGTNFYAVAGGKLVEINGGTAMPALTGIAIPAGYFGVVCFFTDSAGNLSMAAGNPAATLAGCGWPQFPTALALVGALIITSAGAFVGGTTPLDTATTVYLSPVGAFDPTCAV
jgi:hypothetical protein